MASRSRKGCNSCKQAKIKCDEVRPSCGTCARRRRPCGGYSGSPSGQSRGRRMLSPRRSGSILGASMNKRGTSVIAGLSMIHGSLVAQDRNPSDEEDREIARPQNGVSTKWINEPDYIKSIILNASKKTPSPVAGPSLVPLEEVLAADQTFIEVYFMRHPSEMIMDHEFFIQEMNGMVVSLMQQSPVAVSESLAAIGESYVKDSMGLALVPSRKMRLLSRLRLINENGSNPELVLMLLLALCGVELVDPHSDGGLTTLSALIDNASMILEVYAHQEIHLNGMARYFVRGLARQDLLISLSYMQQTKIDPHAWLDDSSMSHADRLMGLTTTLVPIMTKLAALAQDISCCPDVISGFSHAGFLEKHEPKQSKELLEREGIIRDELTKWHPVHDSLMSIEKSRPFIFHAYAWKSAAILYLFRLFNRPGSSKKADSEALSMAYETVAHISGSANQIKLSLWPLFIASCELERQEDRIHVSRLFDEIYDARPLVTVKRTKSFCMKIWTSRDAGADWDWMLLIKIWSEGLVPL